MSLSANFPEIMCTLTVKQIVEQPDMVKAMHGAGMRSVRINTAHLEGVNQLEHLASTLKALLPDIKILIDTKGPEMRTTAIVNDDTIKLNKDDIVTVTGTNCDSASTSDMIYVNYPHLHQEVSKGDILLIDDGKLELIVESIDEHFILARVVKGGILGSRKGISAAGVDVNLPAVSSQDEMYINFAAQSHLIDIIAHSFVRSAADVLAVKEAMGSSAKPIIAKIENRQGIDNLKDIQNVSDGILIARGDLTACIGKAAIPEAQAYIAESTKQAAMPLYLATNILPSMMTAAEASAADIAGIKLAIEQGVDVMLLTNETAAGSHPVESVNALSQIILG